jgi:hemin uptake protein HemP
MNDVKRNCSSMRAVAPAQGSMRRPDALPRPTVQLLQSDDLFAGANEVHIEHRGALYRLQRTSLGKLILTK